jgi:LmbE family N-acetylglucosaminyl deacetylase
MQPVLTLSESNLDITLPAVRGAATQYANKTSERVLVLAAHPDDQVLGCGGVMARYAAQANTVGVLIATRGAPDLYSEDYVAGVRRETRAAHEVLNVSFCEQLDFLAPKLDTVPGHALADEFLRVFRTFHPTILYVPHRGDIHGDHQAVYQAALVAARPINGCSVRRILSYETLSESEWAPPGGDMAFVPTVFVNIEKHLAAKMSAMESYASQLKPPPHSRSLRAIEALARLRGAAVSMNAAEAFMLIRDIEG